VSTVYPAIFYGDPQRVVEQAELDAIGCEICTKAAFTWHRVLCLEPKNEMQKGVPYVGHRCKWFEERQ
jgi:hypothetical protein